MPPSGRMLAQAPIRALLPIILLCASTPPAAAGPDDRTFALRAGKIYTVSDGIIIDGTIIVEGGKIAAVGQNLEIPAGMTLHDLRGHVVIPGLIDAETTLASDDSDTSRSIAPEVMALDGWDFFAERRDLLRGGVTAVYLSPGVSASSGAATRLVSGHGCVVKTAGSDDWPPRRVLRERAGLQVTLGERSGRQPSIYDPPVGASPDNPFEVIDTPLPQSRAGAYLALRRLFARAKNALAGGFPAGMHPSGAAELEALALQPLLSGAEHLRVRAHKAHDIFRTLEIAEASGLRMVLEGGAEAERVSEWLVRAEVPVVFAGAFQPGRIPPEDLSSPTADGLFDESAAIRLQRAGVKVVLHSPTDAEVKDLLLQAAAAVRLGMDPAAALRAITLSPAEVLGVEQRIGSIAPGKDADLVVLAGEPLGPEGKPEAVIIDGEVVYHQWPPIDAEVTVIRCGRIITARGSEFPGGVILVKEGKIAYVGPGAILGSLAGAKEVIDARDRVVVPGFIDCGSTAGTHAESLALRFRAGAGASGGAPSASFRLAEALDPENPAFDDLLRAGITSVLIAPEPSAGIAGQISALKLRAAAPREALYRPYAGLLFGGPPDANLRDELKKAKEYHERWKAHEAKVREGARPEPQAPRLEEKYEPFRPLLEGKLPVVVAARGLQAMVDAFKSLRADLGMRVIICGLETLREPHELLALAEEVRRQGEGVLLEPPLVAGSGRDRLNRPRELARAGALLGFRSQAATGGRLLPLEVAYAVHEGFDGGEALRAMTIGAARLFGLDGRVGSIEEGKDADLVFLSGDPFSISTRVLGVMVDGRMVFDADREGLPERER